MDLLQCYMDHCSSERFIIYQKLFNFYKNQQNYFMQAFELMIGENILIRNRPVIECQPEEHFYENLYKI